MLTIQEINAMSSEELAATNKRLGRRFLINRIVVPIAAVIAVQVIVNMLDRKAEANSTQE